MAALLLAALLAACGTGASSSRAPATAATTAPSAAAAGGSVSSASSSDWPTYNRTGARTGRSVTTPAFTAGRLSAGWRAHVDGAVYGQPLVVAGDVVVATENDSVYAFDASTGRRKWMRHLATPVTGGLPCGNIAPSGITGTPVVDVAAGRLWVVTFSAAPYRHVLWSLGLAAGTVTSHRLVDGPGSDARAEQERGALALTDGKVYIPFGGLYGDCSDYHGWVVAAPTSGRGALATYVTPTAREAGIWSPGGPAVGHGSIYVSTGNGSPENAVDDSDSVVRLALADLAVLGTFTPSNYALLSAGDQDLGSTSPVLLPGNLVFQIGKDGVGYLLGAQHLGGVGGQLAQRTVCSGGFGGAATDGLTVVVSCFNGLYAVGATAPSSHARAGLRVIWSATGIAAGPPIIAGGVVWDATRDGRLLGYRLSNGRRVVTTRLSPVATSFPSLSASGDRLFVPEGDQVMSYRGA